MKLHRESFDQKGTYAYYRDPYSVYLWMDSVARQNWYNLGSTIGYSNLNNYIYGPDPNKFEDVLQ